jgi:putative transcriptional regulator
MHQLLEEELVISTDRSTYKVSTVGVNWMLKVLRELRAYVSLVQKTVTNITSCAAIAEHDVSQGQPVGLNMRNGLLFATNQINKGARGITASSARQGEDVGISDIEGLVELTRGRITILQVPGMQRGGSRWVDLKRLQAQVNKNRQVGAIGIEALIALKRADIEPRYLYGVTEAAVEASRCGLSFIAVCTDDAIAGLIKRIQEENLNYELIDLGETKKNMA